MAGWSGYINDNGNNVVVSGGHDGHLTNEIVSMSTNNMEGGDSANFYYNTVGDIDDDAMSIESIDEGFIGCDDSCFSFFTPRSHHNESQDKLMASHGNQLPKPSFMSMSAVDPLTDIQSMTDLDVAASQLIAQDLASLSVAERTILYEEIHGIVGRGDTGNDGSSTTSSSSSGGSVGNFEDPIMIAKKLLEVQVELDKYILQTHGSPYQRAVSINPGYAGSDRFKLMFLRSTAPAYNSKEAAMRILQHFEWKARLFPNDDQLLARPLTLDDLSEEDMEYIRDGSFLFLPIVDMAGRRVYFSKEYISGESTYRAVFYQLCDALWRNEHREQELGLVFIAYMIDFGESTSSNRKVDFQTLIKEVPQIPHFREALPHRETAIHFCYMSPTMRALFQLQQRIASREHRVRVCPHYGSHIECQYQLMSYGIHPKMLPVDEEGKVRSNVVENCINRQRAKERNPIQTNIGVPTGGGPGTIENRAVTPPISVSIDDAANRRITTSSKQAKQGLVYIKEEDITNSDVLLGRGVPIQSHPGNVYLAKVIEEHALEHKRLPKGEKVCLTWKIVKMIQQDCNGRFLEKVTTTVHNDNDCSMGMVDDDFDNGGDLGPTSGSYWKEVDDAAARTKVSVGFRSLVKKQKQKRQQQLEEEQRRLLRIQT